MRGADAGPRGEARGTSRGGRMAVSDPTGSPAATSAPDEGLGREGGQIWREVGSPACVAERRGVRVCFIIFEPRGEF